MNDTLRIVEKLIDSIVGIDENTFVIGNIASDSGVPKADWTSYTPSKLVSHYYAYKEDGEKIIDIDVFCAKYFTKELIKAYSTKEYSFFLGYYIGY